MNRRDLLKLFGVGAAVVPIIGGAPQLAAEATLLTKPEVRPVIVPTSSQMAIGDLIDCRRIAAMEVVLKANGTAYYFAADTFISEARAEWIDVTNVPEWFPGRSEVMWELKGRCIGTAKVTTTVRTATAGRDPR